MMETQNILPVTRQNSSSASRKGFVFIIPLVYPVIFFIVIVAAFATGLAIATGNDHLESLTLLAVISHPVIVVSLLGITIFLTLTATYYSFHNRRYPVIRMQGMIQEIEKERDEIIRQNRDLELARIDLAQKTEHMELINKYRSEFLANMSHELRTPLNSIIVLSQLMAENRKKNMTDKQVEYVRTIFTSGNNLLELINEILDISKIESGKFDVVPESVNLRGLLQEVEKMFLPVARKKELEFSVEVNDEVPASIFTDAKRLSQIIRNLVSNAIKFTQQGGIRLIVSVKSVQPGDNGNTYGGKKIHFAVADTGIGIPANQLKSIFEPYRQADISTSRKFGGTGLGLTISRNLSQLLGGEIIVTSEEGKGSEFTLVIPENYRKENTPKPRSHSVNRCDACNGSGNIDFPADDETEVSPKYACTFEDDREAIRPGDRSLLIIDDDPAFSGIVADLAREEGFRCVLAHNGECGLKCADYFKPSAIILDICLPGLNGWQVMERIQNDENLKNIPVFFISGADETVEVTRMGAAGYLSKPVNVEKIGEALRLLENIIGNNGKPEAIQQNPEFLASGNTILLVDDDPFNMFAMRSLLEEKGLAVITASNGKDCLEVIRRYTEIDLVLMDFMMPEMDGCKVIRMIRNMRSYNDLPVITVTARAQEQDKRICLEAGANDYLAKPVDAHKLFEKLNEWLGSKERAVLHE